MVGIFHPPVEGTYMFLVYALCEFDDGYMYLWKNAEVLCSTWIGATSVDVSTCSAIVSTNTYGDERYLWIWGLYDQICQKIGEQPSTKVLVYSKVYSLGKYIRSNVCLDILSYMHDIAIPTKDLGSGSQNSNFDFLHSLTSGRPPLVLSDITLKICIFDVPNYILKECLYFKDHIQVCFVGFML